MMRHGNSYENQETPATPWGNRDTAAVHRGGLRDCDFESTCFEP